MVKTETKTICWYASQGSELTKLACALHYSPRQTSRICEKIFGMTFQQLKNIFKLESVLNQIVKTGSAATVQEFSDEPAVRKFLHKHFPGTLKDIIGGKKMDEYKIVQEIASALNELSNTDQCISQTKLGISDQAIIEMRKKGIPLISIPGRNGGYSLNQEKAEISRRWINHWRQSMRIEGEFSYAHLN